jgi:hypothetical protein
VLLGKVCVTATKVCVAATKVGATATKVCVTATKVGATATKVCVTATKVCVSATKVGATATKVGVTATKVGVTATTIAMAPAVVAAVQGGGAGPPCRPSAVYTPPMTEIRDLQALREAIEEIDREILTHLRRRMSLAEEVAGAKLRTAYPFRDEQDTPFHGMRQVGPGGGRPERTSREIVSVVKEPPSIPRSLRLDPASWIRSRRLFHPSLDASCSKSGRSPPSPPTPHLRNAVENQALRAGALEFELECSGLGVVVPGTTKETS